MPEASRSIEVAAQGRYIGRVCGHWKRGGTDRERTEEPEEQEVERPEAVNYLLNPIFWKGDIQPENEEL